MTAAARRARGLVGLVGLVGLAPGVAAADDADACSAPLADPVALAWRDTGVDGGRGACARPGASLVLGGRALVDTPAFYGTLAGDVTVSLRLADGPIEWLVAARAPAVTFVQNAVLAATTVGYGPVTVGAMIGDRARLRGRPLRWAVAARVDLPFTEDRLGSTRAAGQLAALATWPVASGWRLHGRLAVVAARTWSELGGDGRAAGAATVDVTRAVARRRLFVGAGIDGQLGWYGPGLDHLAVRAGAQLRVTGAWRTTLAVGLPVAGAERTDLGFALGVSRDLP